MNSNLKYYLNIYIYIIFSELHIVHPKCYSPLTIILCSYDGRTSKTIILPGFLQIQYMRARDLYNYNSEIFETVN